MTFPADRETAKMDARELTAYGSWVAYQIRMGNLASAAMWMPMSDVLWQWEQYTGLTAPTFDY